MSAVKNVPPQIARIVANECLLLDLSLYAVGYGCISAEQHFLKGYSIAESIEHGISSASLAPE